MKTVLCLFLLKILHIDSVANLQSFVNTYSETKTTNQFNYQPQCYSFINTSNKFSKQRIYHKKIKFNKKFSY